MNIKTIVIGSLALSLAVGASYLKLSENKEAVYTPKKGLSKSEYNGPDRINEYLNMLRGNPSTGVVDMNDYYKARTEVLAVAKANKNKTSELGMEWEQKGPDNVGGRTRAVLVDINNSNIVYAGSVAGGLFVSQDAGSTWNPVNSLGENLAISCITQTDNGRIFFGTGSTFETPNGSGLFTPGFPGNGVYEYIPSTQTVSRVIVENTTTPVNSTTGDLSRVNQIAAMGNRLYIGLRVGLRYADLDGTGNYPTTIAGWTNPVEIPGSGGILKTTEVQDIDIASDGSMMVSYGGETYTSQDGTSSFVRHSFPGTSRISSAIAPSDPDYLYVIGTGGSGTLTNFWASTDRGTTWDIVVPGGVPSIDPFVQLSGTGGQGDWDQAIAVDPSNPLRVLVGGIQFYEYVHNLGQTPPGGNWTRAANLNEATGTPFYIHADNHTIAWKDPNVVYVGGDGGVFRSTDGGVTWYEINLGFNVTTFFSVATAANGYFAGGSQDNGTQLYDFQEISGWPSPDATFEVQGGDGFSCAFSNFSGGIIYSTSQYGSVNRLSPGGTGGSFFDAQVSPFVGEGNSPFNTEIRNWESFNDTLTVDSVEVILATDTVIGPGQPYTYASLTASTMDLTYEPAVAESYNAGDTLTLPDPIQNKFVFSSGADIYMTRDAAKFTVNPEWHKIADNSNVTAMQFSPDGNHLYLGNSAGQVFRVSGLSLGNDEGTLDIDLFTSTTFLGFDTTNITIDTTIIIDPVLMDTTIVIDTIYTINDILGPDLVTTKTMIASGLGGVVTGIAVDPNNGENLIATVGNYGVTNHVWRTITAQSATALGGFAAIQGTPIPTATGYLPRMPVYDAEIDMTDNNFVVIGTDFGVWASDNAFTTNAADVKWYNESETGMAHVPVFEVVQQTLPLGNNVYPGFATNSMMYYLGTHGRGFYTSGSRIDSTVSSINEVELSKNEAISLSIYPNPINNLGTIDFDLYEDGQTTVQIFNLNGSLVKTIDLGVQSKGNHTERIDVSSLSIGTYIVSLQSNSDRKISKMIITR